MTKDQAALLDKEEGGNRFYKSVQVNAKTYDGKEIKAEAYIATSRTVPLPVGIYPSKRYLNLIIMGAKECKLDPEYIEVLERHPFYKPSSTTIKRREEIPDISTLPKMSLSELKKRDGSDNSLPIHTSVLGYVIEINKDSTVFNSNKGRDVTHRYLLNCRGMSMDKYDKGERPYPNISSLSDEEHEYIKQNLDALLCKGTIVACLEEFLEDQKSQQASL